MATLLKGKQISPQTVTISGSTGNVIVKGDLDMLSYNVVISGTPTANNQAVNKAYVDAVAQGLIPHAPVKVVALTTVSSLTGTTTIDGYVTSADDRVLLTNQGGTGIGDSNTQNGLWLVKVGAWTRPTDADGTPSNEVALGDFVYVETGNTYTSSGWVLAGTDGNSDNNIEVGVEAQKWVQVSAPGQYSTDGEGIELVGNVFNLELDGTTLSKSGTGLRVSSSLLTTISTDISTAVSGEASIRTSADSSLSTDLSSEISTRKSVNTSLSTAISTEISTRNSVDTSLSTVIGNIQAPTYFEQLLIPVNSGSSTAVNIGTAFVHGVTDGSVDESTIIVFLNGIEYTFEYTQGTPAVFHTDGVTPTSTGTTLYFDGVEAGFAIETTDGVKIKYVVTIQYN
jgi:hypothetical protein